MDFSLRKSFKSHGSYKQVKKISAGGGHSSSSHEELPILSDHDVEDNGHDHRFSYSGEMGAASSNKNEVIVKINGGGNSSEAVGGKLKRENSANGPDGDESFQFAQTEDPPSKLIGNFLHRQRASGDMTLDMDLEMDELRRSGGDIERGYTPTTESPQNSRSSKDLRVSFHPSPSEAGSEISQNDAVRRRFKDLRDDKNDEFQNCDAEEVVKCTSNASYQRDISFQRGSTLLRLKTRSRLIDPPEEPGMRSDRTHISGQIPKSGQIPRSGMIPKSGQLRSGLLGGLDEDEDDPFSDEDLPDDFKKANLSALTLLQWASLILIIGALACTLAIPYLRQKDLLKLMLWKWEVLVLVLICGRLVSGWVIRIVVFFIERNFVLRKRVLYFVYGVRKAVQNCLWLGLVLIAWHLLFDRRVERETRSEVLKYVTKILICLLMGTLLWLVKTLIVKVLASSFHVSTYFDRIQDSLFNQFVIETLSGPPLIEMYKAEEEEERLADEVQQLQNAGATIPPDLKDTAFPRTSRVIGSGRLSKLGKSPRLSRSLGKGRDGRGISIDHLHKLNPKNVSAWKMKSLMRMVRHGTLTTLDEQVLDSTHEDESTTQIRSEVQAKAAAKKIFLNVSKRGSK